MFAFYLRTISYKVEFDKQITIKINNNGTLSECKISKGL